MKELKGNDSNKYAAGILIICPFTKRMLLGLRSSDCEYSNTWCNFGGMKKNDGESMLECAKRECMEETEISPDVIDEPLYVNHNDSGITYNNYLGILQEETVPTINAEHADYNWYRLSELNDIRLNTEFANVFDNPEAINKINQYLL